MSTRQIVTNVWKNCNAHLQDQAVEEETPLFLIFQKVSNSLPADMAYHSRRLEFSATVMQEPQISQKMFTYAAYECTKYII
jgi:hypothetical protein